MGYFANERIKKGTSAVKAYCKEAMPKNYAPKAGTPQKMATSGTSTDISVNQAPAPYNMNSAQIRQSRRQP